MLARIVRNTILSTMLLMGPAIAAPPKIGDGLGVPLFTRRLPLPRDYAIEAMKARAIFMRSGDILIRVYGTMSQRQLHNLTESLSKIPVSLKGYCTDIYVTHDIGKLAIGNVTLSRIVGLGGDGRIIIDRNVLSSVSECQEVLYHEMGHNFDVSHDSIGCEAPWGVGESLTEYGSTSNREDFAEFFMDVVKNYKEYQERTKEEWLKDKFAAKKLLMWSYLPK